jgi:hypothetical protein
MNEKFVSVFPLFQNFLKIFLKIFLKFSSKFSLIFLKYLGFQEPLMNSPGYKYSSIDSIEFCELDVHVRHKHRFEMYITRCNVVGKSWGPILQHL